MRALIMPQAPHPNTHIHTQTSLMSSSLFKITSTLVITYLYTNENMNAKTIILTKSIEFSSN